MASPAGPAPTTATSRAAAVAAELGEALGHLEPLHDRVPDEPHPAQLADDVDPWPRGLEERVDLGEVDAALGGAEHEPDRAHRALRGAPAVADAVVGVDEPRRAVHDARGCRPRGRRCRQERLPMQTSGSITG